MDSLYNAIAKHMPLFEDEMLLEIGDKVTVTHVFEDQWCMAIKETGESGLIPFCFLSKDRASTMTSIPIQRSSSLSSKGSTTNREGWMSLDQYLSSYSKAPLSRIDNQEKLNEYFQSRINHSNLNPTDIGNLKIIFLGDSEIGKSTLLSNFKTSPQITSTLIPTRINSILTEHSCSTNKHKNISLIDSLGTSTTTDPQSVITPVLNYMLSEFTRTNSLFKNVEIHSLKRYLETGSGVHEHVDVCIYAILHRIKKIDIEFMKQISKYTTVIPVIVKSDSLTRQQILTLKKEIIESLEKERVDFFRFGLDLKELKENCLYPNVVPFAVSVYNEDGIVNEMELLKQFLFYSFKDDIRCTSADKFVRWRNSLPFV